VPTIISVHSYRGGTGKTNTTANLAAMLVRHGKRVAIVETDIQAPGIHVLFGLDAKAIRLTLNDYLWGRCAIDEVAYDVHTTIASEAPSGRLFVVPASVKAGEIARILREGYDVALLNNGFQQLVKGLQLDFLFIDTHPGLNEETLLSIAVSDLLIVLLRPDRQDYQGTAVTLDVARRLGVPKLFILMNKVLPSFDGEELRQHVETVFEAPVGGILPLCEDMIRLGSGGIYCLHHREHQYTRVLQSVADRLLG
jgi:MinD-like ATPase involved in chromosome partitioning or flagellar assembly